MTDRQVLLDIAEDIAIIRLNRPDRLNALSVELLGEILSAFDAIDTTSFRAILLTGEGRAFCSGGDLASDSLAEIDPGEALDTAFHPLLRRIATLDVPLVTAINGPAVGAGMALAMLGDISVMASSAYLQAAFVRIGLVPDFALSWALARSVGRTRALEIALLGEKIEADAALNMGLVTRLADDDACLDAAMAIARQLANGPRTATGLIRRQIAAALDVGFEEVLAIERANQSVAAKSGDFREGFMAFREKRLPNFKGR